MRQQLPDLPEWLGRLREWPAPVLAGVSLVAWLVLGLQSRSAVGADICGSLARALTNRDGWTLMVPLLVETTWRPLAVQWFWMVLATMPLTLTQPVDYVWRRSLPRNRWRAVACLAAGYVASWMAAGALLLVPALAAAALFDALHLPRLAGAALVVAVWQLSPWKQACLNRCHHLPHLPAFGWSADAAIVVYGVRTAQWCVGACWALMIAPWWLANGHLGWMLACSLLVLLDRAQPPRPVRWRLPDTLLPARLQPSDGPHSRMR